MHCCKKRNAEEPVEQDDQDQRSKEKKFEDYLLYKIKHGSYEDIENEIKPRALKYCESNSLLMGMKVSFELRRLATSKGPDENRFNQLANSVENFTCRLLDPLKCDQRRREEFGDDLDGILEDAIYLQQKKYFTHPVVDTEMKRKWHGREFLKTEWSRWRVLFAFLCLFDLMLSPILFAVCSLMRRKSRDSDSHGKHEERNNDEGEKQNLKKTKTKQCLSASEIYLLSLETPYFKFVRDTLSYIVLLVLHYALCLSPTTVTFSGLEWTILIFFIGRFLVERKQMADVLQHLKRQRENGSQSKFIHLKALLMYQSDLWNKLDLISLLVYLVTLILRLATSIMSRSAMNNRVLAIAGYLYSANTLCLTFRVFGHVLEQSKDVGTIQIALFSILTDISVVIWQFTAAILAFSIAITKLFMVEKSFIASASDDIVCKKSGISCWWTMITYLGWSLLGISEDLDPLKAADFPSESLARILYAGFLIMGVILLVNMLIALLSNTYQRIKDNSLKEWSFKSAATIQTYDGYDPIPVPLNIIYSAAKLLKLVKKKENDKGMMLEILIIDLDREYSAKYGNFFPVPDDKIDDPVVQETCGNRKMISQILNSTFTFQGAVDHGVVCPAGLEAWEAHTGVRIEGNHLTCEDTEHCPECPPNKKHWPGARYLKRFSPEFPHFEVAILETGKQIMMAIGVVNEGYDTSTMPGWEKGTVGYQTDGNIYDAAHEKNGRATKGPVLAFRGDQIRCTVMFEEEQMKRGKAIVPICFTLNGRKILIKSTRQREITDRIYMDHDKPLYPYIGMADGCSVLAKMCSRENAENEISKNEELIKKVTKIEESLEETNRKFDLMFSRENARAEQDISKTENLSRKVTKLEETLEETNRKLDTLLSRLTHQEQSG